MFLLRKYCIFANCENVYCFMRHEREKWYLLRFIALIIIALCLNSCSNKQDGLVLLKDFQGEMWGRFDYLEASYNVVKAPMTADLVMDIEVSEVYPNDYPYHGKEDEMFTFELSVNAPDGSRRTREFKFRLKDSEGNFKSEKNGGYYHFELPLIDEMSFNTVGEYHFKVENKYSKDPLCGIKRLSINCLKINN